MLEASLRNNVPHASVCGGRARCSTCRVSIISDRSDLPEPSRREAFVLAGSARRIPPSALPASCGRRPTSRSFQLFLPHTIGADFGATANTSMIGQERYLVSMFVDMRGSTSLSEEPPAVRHRVHRQPLRRRGVAGGAPRAAASRTSSSATACWRCSGCRPSGEGLPAGAAGGGADRRQCRRTEPISRARSARADPVSASASMAAK